MPPDRDLDRELRDLGLRIEYPPVPDLAPSVRSRLEGESETADPPARSRPQLWWIAAAAIVLLVAVPVFASVLNTMGGAFSGGAAAGGGSGGGSVAESEQQGAADVAEQTQPSLAMESGASATSAETACASLGPILLARPARGAPGDAFGIRGSHFDGNSRDCDNDPARDVRVEFLQDGRRWDLGRLVSDKDSRLAAKLEVPADAKPGHATVRATYGQEPPKDPYGRSSVEALFFVTK